MIRQAWTRPGVLLFVVACSTYGADGLPVDAGADDAADAGDGAEPADADVDSGSLVDVVAERGCGNRPIEPAHFCDDFDVGGDVGFRWSQRLISDGGAVTETDAAFSAPRALVAGFPNGAAPQTTARLLRKRDPALSLADKQRILVSFALRARGVSSFPLPPNGHLGAMSLVFDPTVCGGATRSFSLNFVLSGELRLDIKGFGGAACPDAATGHFDYVTAPFDIAGFEGSFRTVTVEILRQGCPGATGAASVSVSVDGVGAPCKTLVEDPFALAGRLDLIIGAFAGVDVGETELVFDDVKLDVQ